MGGTIARPLLIMTCVSRVTPGGAMRPTQYTITRRTVHVYAEYVCQRHIRLKAHGRKCTTGVLWALLFWAASRISSLAAACATLRDAPSDTAAHDALLAT